MRESITKARKGLDEVEKLVNWMDSADLAERVSVSVAYSKYWHGYGKPKHVT